MAKQQTSRTPKKVSRKLKQPKYKSFRLHKRIKHPGNALPSAWNILKTSTRHLLQHKKLFFGIALVYLLLTLVLVRGFVFSTDLSATKEAVQEVLQGTSGQLLGALSVYSLLLSSNTASTQAASVYQMIFVVLTSLVVIWALRQTHAKQQITVKDAYYRSSYPLVPFVLVLCVLGLQMLPFMAGAFLYNATVASGLAVTGIEIILWTFLAFLLALWTAYMITATAFALYIITLPDMTPLRALKSAKTLVQFRRWTIMRKVLFLPFITVIIGVVVLLPVIMFLTPASEILFLLLSAMAVPFGHSYMYSLYRELL